MQFIKYSKLWVVVSSIMIGLSIFAMVTKGFNLGIDFTGGTSLMLRFANPQVDLAKVRATLQSEKTEITLVDNKDFLIKTTVLTEDQKKLLLQNLTKNFGAVTVLEADSVGPSIGKKLQSDSWMILLFAISAMLIYVTFRFEFLYGLSAVLALVHDCFITLGFVAWLQLDVNMALLAAILTILGYSINDTIIVFDRVREDVVKTDNKGKEIGILVNSAINSTLSRCINTVLTVLIATGSLYLFGGSTIKEFALILLIGFGFGSYSSLCVAPPLFVFFKKNQD